MPIKKSISGRRKILGRDLRAVVEYLHKGSPSQPLQVSQEMYEAIAATKETRKYIANVAVTKKIPVVESTDEVVTFTSNRFDMDLLNRVIATINKSDGAVFKTSFEFTGDNHLAISYKIDVAPEFIAQVRKLFE